MRPFVALLALLLVGISSPLRADSPKEKPLIRDFLGLNAHVTFKPELYRPICGELRNYHPMVWDNGGDTSFLPPFPHGKTPIVDAQPIDWLRLFGSWKKYAFTIDDCIQIETIKPDAWKQLEPDAFAYGQAYAREFGPGGDGAVSSVEIGNEPANYDNATYRKVFENMAKGLRTGDPALKIVTCNLSADVPDRYSKSVSCLDGLDDLYDVLNIHTYSMIEGWPTWRRVNPEHADIPYLKAVDDLIAWRDAHVPGKQIWITEFGYDAKSADAPAATGDFAKWVSSTETEQAQWLVRSVLVFSALDVDRAYIYDYNDKDQPIFHGSSGLTRNFQPKPSYYALCHLQQTLGNYRFSKIITQQKDDLYVYEYANPDAAGDLIWVAWSPTGSQRTATQKIAFPGQLLKAEHMPLEPGPAPTVDCKTDADGVEIALDESPVYLWLKE